MRKFLFRAFKSILCALLWILALSPLVAILIILVISGVLVLIDFLNGFTPVQFSPMWTIPKGP